MRAHEAPRRPQSELVGGYWVCARCRRAWRPALDGEDFLAWCVICDLNETDLTRMPRHQAEHWRRLRNLVRDPPVADVPQKWLTTRQVKAHTGVSLRTIERARKSGALQYRKKGAYYTYRLEWVEAWMDANAYGERRPTPTRGERGRFNG